MSHVRIHKWHLASFAGYPAEHADACLRVLARDKSLLELVAANPALPESLWFSLWEARLPVNLACALVARPLGPAQRDTVTARELRVKVLSALIEHNALSSQEQELLLADKVPSAVAERLLEQPWLDADLRRRAALAAGGLGLLRELAFDTGGTFSDVEAAALISEYASWAPTDHFRERSLALRVLLHRRPGLLDVALDSGETTLVTSAAGSWHLSTAQAKIILEMAKALPPKSGFREEFSYAVLALVNNPVVELEVALLAQDYAKGGGISTEQVVSSVQRRVSRPAVTGPIEELEDPSDIAWMLRRSLPNDYSPGRPLELALLALNVHLSAQDRETVLGHLSNVDQRLLLCFPELSSRFGEDLGLAAEDLSDPVAAQGGSVDLPTWVRQPCQDLVDHLAGDPTAWETMVSLLDEFDGPLEELCALSRAL